MHLTPVIQKKEKKRNQIYQKNCRVGFHSYFLDRNFILLIRNSINFLHLRTLDKTRQNEFNLDLPGATG